jgi:hypothetical protein
MVFDFVLKAECLDTRPASERFYGNYNRRGQGYAFDGRPRGRGARGRGGRGRGDGSRYADRQEELPPDDTSLWPALPSTTKSSDE